MTSEQRDGKAGARRLAGLSDEELMAEYIDLTRTNGDRVQPVVEHAKKALARGLTHVREHPDEALVAALPVLAAFHLSVKYDMGLADHLLITQAGWQVGALLLKEYREWKTRPARPSPREVV